MMPVYFLILLASGIFIKVDGFMFETKNDTISFQDRLENLIEKHCMENANETAYQEAIDELNEFVYNWQIVLPTKKIYGRELYRYCLENSKNFTSYLTEFVEKLSPCLGSEEEYLKKFIIDSYGNYNHYFCKQLTVTGSTKIRMENCFEYIKEDVERNPSVVCFRDSAVFGDNSTLSTITKLDLCQDIKAIYTCFAETIREHCPTAPEIEEYSTNLMKQSLAQCYGVLPNLRIKYQ